MMFAPAGPTTNGVFSAQYSQLYQATGRPFTAGGWQTEPLPARRNQTTPVI